MVGKSKLRLDYSNNKAFSDHGGYSWEVDTKLVNDFNELYVFYKNNSCSIDFETLEQLQENCSDLLRAIFISLKYQVKEDFEIVFLNELELAATTVLKKELLFYADTEKLNYTDGKFIDYNNELNNNGFFIDSLSEVTLNKILELLEPVIAKLRINAKEGKNRREELSSIEKPIPEVARILNQEFDSFGINQSVSFLCKHKMHVTGLCIELSTPNSSWWKYSYESYSESPETEYFHFDESIDHPKAIIYLTKVGVENGPTSLVPNLLESMELSPLQILIGRVINYPGFSQDILLKERYHPKYHQPFSCINYRQDFVKLPVAMRFNSHFGWDVIPCSSLEGYMVENEVKMLGEAGRFVVFDGGNVVHRGGLIKSGERVVLQVIFGKQLDQRIMSRVKRKVSSLLKSKKVND